MMIFSTMDYDTALDIFTQIATKLGSEIARTCVLPNCHCHDHMFRYGEYTFDIAQGCRADNRDVWYIQEWHAEFKHPLNHKNVVKICNAIKKLKEEWTDDEVEGQIKYCIKRYDTREYIVRDKTATRNRIYESVCDIIREMVVLYNRNDFSRIQKLKEELCAQIQGDNDENDDLEMELGFMRNRPAYYLVRYFGRMHCKGAEC